MIVTYLSNIFYVSVYLVYTTVQCCKKKVSYYLSYYLYTLIHRLLTTSTIITKTSIFTLFHLKGVYGDVIRVKILFNKKDTALIQFSTALQAQVGQYSIFVYHISPTTSLLLIASSLHTHFVHVYQLLLFTNYYIQQNY